MGSPGIITCISLSSPQPGYLLEENSHPFGGFGFPMSSDTSFLITSRQWELDTCCLQREGSRENVRQLLPWSCKVPFSEDVGLLKQ